MNNALVVMAKRPLLGQTKTRLTPPLSPEQATELYANFLQDTLDLARQVPNVVRWIAFTPPNMQDYFAQLASDFSLIPQIGNDLGERLDNVLIRCFGDGFERVVLMSSDSPTLPARHVVAAFEFLERADVVLGPCEDGGYYLIGAKRPQPRLVREVQMSTPSVLKDTLTIAREENLVVRLVAQWYDIDTVGELEQLRQEMRLSKTAIAPHTRKFLETLCA